MQLNKNQDDSSDQYNHDVGKGMKIFLFYKPFISKVCFSLFLLTFIFIKPAPTNAGFIADIITKVTGTDTEAAPVVDNSTNTTQNSQNIPLLESSINPDMANIVDTPENAILGNDMFLINNGLIGSGLENISTDNGIVVYEVKDGDTLSQIAEDYNISPNTIRWENDITGQNIKIGQKLNILPVTGIKHVVKKGDTLAGIANKYDADTEDIKVFNDIKSDDILKVGDIIYVPNGVPPTEVTPKSSSSTSSTKTTTSVSGTKAPTGYYIRPASGKITSPYGSRKGGFHYGVDIGNVRGTQVVAAASGVVVGTVSSCVEGNTRCGGRYGNYIIIEHPNGTSTRYAHLSKVLVSVGETVSQGDRIGKIGNTGGSTGPHLHFQIEKASGATMKPPF